MLETQFSSKVDLTRFGNELFNYKNKNYVLLLIMG